GKLNFVDAVDRLLQIRLGDAVKLQSLARGDAERAIADFVAQVEFSEQLLAGQLAAGDGGADHEHVGLAVSAAVVSIVLLVGAVVLEELNAALAEEVVAVDKLFGDFAAEIVAGGLEALDGAELFL